MTTYYLSLNRGQLDNKLGNVTVGTSAPSADFYLQISMTNTPTRKDVVRALESFVRYINAGGINGGTKGTDLPPL